MSINQQTIAERLDISVATVSRSLRNHKGINPRTRARVLQAASELGYRLTSIAATTPPRESITNLGVLVMGRATVSGMDAAVRTRILEGIAEQARREDVALHLDYIPEEFAERIDEPELQPIGLRQRVWRGTILVGHFKGAVAKRFAMHNTCVKVADYVPGHTVDCVDHNDADSCDKLVEHLWGLGHKRIGFIACTPHHPCTVSRYGGVCAALATRGVLPMVEDMVNLTKPELSREAIAKAIQSRVAAGVTGWICENDRVGYQLIEDLRPLGLDCPRDLSVCGFDNLPAPASLPKLTSIDAPFEEMGAMAVSRLMQRLERDALDTTHTMLTCRLIAGSSTQGSKS